MSPTTPPMRRARVLTCALAITLLAAAFLWRGASRETGSGGSAQLAAARRPNVIVYLVDTLRADHLGIYGYHRDTSPVIDDWASSAVVFERAYAPCSWTKPSMVSLLSGLDPAGHGVEDRLDVIPVGIRMLSERLKAGGYATFAAVTNPNVLPHWGFARGFDVYDDLDSAGHGTRADTVSDYAVERMEELVRAQPFFLYLHVLDPHAPYDPPPPFDTRFPLSPGFPKTMSVGHYDGEIAFVDSQFGRIVDALEAHGLANDTMTIFVSDHGEELFDHGSFGHGTKLFEESVRIPLVIRFPDGEHAGTRIGARATLADVVPTVMSVTSRSVPTDVDGRDLTELLDGGDTAWADRDLFLSLRTTGQGGQLVRAVLRGPHKYLRRWRPNGSESLYDIERDPAEANDLTSAQPELHERLAATLDTYLAKKSSGIHLRIVNDFSRDPVECDVMLETTGRFIDVSEVRLESGDRVELSDDGRRLKLGCRLENRIQQLRARSRLVPDEDGLVFMVDPPSAPVVVQHSRLADGRNLSLRAGAHRGLEAVPFTFVATAAALSVRDVGELLGDAGSVPERSTVTAYLGVIQPSAEREEVPQGLLDRLRALGYVASGGRTSSKREVDEAMHDPPVPTE